jgi:probable phosphoglycerate mutase
MIATRIIAIRHGETAWNVGTRIQGHLDIDLNDKGRWQATRVGHALADEAITRIYSSDLSRAHATALAIAEKTSHPLAHTVQLHPGLRERGFGTFEGKTWLEIETQWPEEARRWRQRDPEFSPPGGETLVQLKTRVQKALNDIAQNHLDEQIVLVAHGGVMDILYRLATQQDLSLPRSWNLGNAAINRLLWTPDAFTLVGWADTSHLDEAGLDENSA